MGVGRNFGAVQANVSLGQTWATQSLEEGGSSKTGGTFLYGVLLAPLVGNLWGVLSAYHHWGEAELRRGYLNAGRPDASSGSPDVRTVGGRARLEWDEAFKAGKVAFSPYADFLYALARLDGYIETGGGFPARFGARTKKATEARLGVNGALPLSAAARLVGLVEGAHRFKARGAGTSGQLIGLGAFALAGRKNDQDWFRGSLGIEGKLGNSTASLMVNATTQGEMKLPPFFGQVVKPRLW